MKKKATTKPTNAEKKQDSKFKPGKSGNPKGKQPGTKNRSTLIVEKLIDGEAENIAKKAIELALEGNPIALRLVLERLYPPRRDRPVNIQLPKLETANDVVAAIGKVIEEVGEGNIDPSQGQTISAILDTKRKAIETADLERRLIELEERLRK